MIFFRSNISYLDRFQNYSDTSDGDVSAAESGLVTSCKDATCYYASASAVSEDSSDEKICRKFYSEPKLIKVNINTIWLSLCKIGMDIKSETVSSTSSVEWPDLMPECSRMAKSFEPCKWEAGDGSALSDLGKS